MKTRTAPKQQKDSMGFPMCRMPDCGKRVGKGRRSYCSQDCADRFAVAYFPNEARRSVFTRDRGVCAKCRCDTEKLRRVLKWVEKLGYRSKPGDYYGEGRRTASETSRSLGFNSHYQPGGFWQADHIQECVNGGWGMGLENFRTLCTPCHKEETSRLAAELAERRRREKQEAKLRLDGVLFGAA